MTTITESCGCSGGRAGADAAVAYLQSWISAGTRISWRRRLTAYWEVVEWTITAPEQVADEIFAEVARLMPNNPMNYLDRSQRLRHD